MKHPQEYFIPTRFAGINPWKARLIIAAFIAVVLWGIITCEDIVREFKKSEDGALAGDPATYHRILERVRAGEGYYKVVGEELRARGYGVRPFFNWKLPTLTYLLAIMPSMQTGKFLLIILTIISLILWLKLLANKGGFYMALVGALLLSGVAACSITRAGYLFYEMWAGVLIALSIAAYKHNRPISIASGLLALFIRELTLPFAVIMLALAYKDKRRKEVIVWLIGILVFFIYLAIHAKIVSGLITDTDRKSISWFQFGGWQFILSTSKWTLFTYKTPWWGKSIIIPLAILGLAGWRNEVGIRAFLTMSAYICAFLIVGRDNNYYWGFMYVSLMPLGLAHAPPCLLDLFKSGLRGFKRSNQNQIHNPCKI
jgi:hypothetical protein